MSEYDTWTPHVTRETQLESLLAEAVAYIKANRSEFPDEPKFLDWVSRAKEAVK